MNIIRFLVPTSLSFVLLACPPIEPFIDGGPDPVDGLWRMEIISAGTHGNCGMIDISDLQDVEIGMNLDTRNGSLVRFQIEGLELKGETDGGWVRATGRMIPDVRVSHPVDDSGDDGRSDVDVGVEQSEELGAGFRSEEDASTDGYGGALHASLDAYTRTPHLMDGELVIEYDTNDLQCTLALAFSANHEGRSNDIEDPVPVAPAPVEAEAGVEEAQTKEG